MLPRFLDPGDLVVINTSGTIPRPSTPTADDGTALAVHLSTQLDGGPMGGRAAATCVAARPSGGTDRSRPALGPWPDGGTLTLDEPYATVGACGWPGSNWAIRTLSWLAVHGRPIRYRYVERPWPIEMYQNVYATEPGSAEMPSAGRPFTPEVSPDWSPRELG